ncbi:MAG: acyl-CoA dehydrogenase [Sporichthyaceae bacterium]
MTWPNPDEVALAAEVRRLLERSAPRDDVRNAPESAHAQHEQAWKALATQLGVAALAVPEELGGAGGDIGALAVVADEIGRAAAAVPFLSSSLAAEVLVRSGAKQTLAELICGAGSTTLVIPLDGSGAEISAAESSSDGWVLTGTARRVLDGVAAEQLVVLARTTAGVGLFLVGAGEPGVSAEPLQVLDLGRPQARVTFEGATAECLALDGSPIARHARRLTILLIAAEQCGIATRSLEVAVEYAKTREQFGAPIGSFQAVKHLLAGLYAQSELARALLVTAVDLMRESPDAADTRVAVNAASIGANEAALAATAGAVQVLGGIGFTWEHDAHLYFRRARANAVLAGTTAERKDALAEMLLAGKGVSEPAPPCPADVMDFATRAAEWFAQNTSPISSEREDEESTFAAGKAFRRALADAGLAGLTFPVAYGGAGLSMAHDTVAAHAAKGREIFENLFGIGTGMCAPVLLTLGTEAQKQRYLRPLLRGEHVWCQLFSEPGAGSDLASLRTRAVRDGDEWVVNGQKVWTTYAHRSDYALMLARTDPDVAKHKGITMFIVDMRAPGITARPLRQMTGDSEFNEVFLDEVHLPADAVVGELNGGWNAALVMLMNERVLLGRDPLTMSPPVTFGPLRELVLARGVGQDAAVRTQLADVFVLERSLQLLGHKIGATLQPGVDPGPYASISKFGAAQLARLTTEIAFAVAGGDAAAWAPGDEDGGRWAHSVLFAPALAIAGGTDQIQRTIIGERLLGLPRG